MCLTVLESHIRPLIHDQFCTDVIYIMLKCLEVIVILHMAFYCPTYYMHKYLHRISATVNLPYLSCWSQL